MEALKQTLEKAENLMEKAYAHTHMAFSKIRAGRAMPDILDSITILYYDAATPINQIAAITAPDAKTLVIKPWEKRCLADIEKAILHSQLGFNPQNDGEVIRINIPPLTQERRKELAKQVKQEAEKGKIAVRNIRKDIKDIFKTLQKEGASEDLVKKAEDDLQAITDRKIQQIDILFVQKETEILTV